MSAVKQDRRPQAVMLSKRANVFYLEHVSLMQREERVVYLTQGSDSIEQLVSIPDKNTAFILLGKGTSITDSAMRKLAESNVLVGFCGSGGSPLFGASDINFILPQDEYRPPMHAQRWFEVWSNEACRIELGRAMLNRRIEWDRAMFAKLDVVVEQSVFDAFDAALQKSRTTQDMLSAEAVFAKRLYASLAQTFAVGKFTRDQGAKKQVTPEQRINSFLDHGNYLAYGYAAVALHGMGVPYFLPVLHGKTRRGALVFDIADLFKDWLVMPSAFNLGSLSKADQHFRAEIIEKALAHNVLDHIMTFISEVPEKVLSKQ